MAIIIILFAALVIYLAAKYLKIPKIGAVTMVNGAVKSGKTMFSVYLAVLKYHGAIIKYHIKRIIAKVFKKPAPEKPLLYSNIPLKVKGYTPITRKHLRREVRFPYGSVIYLCESSLVADSMSYKDDLLNEELLLFNKLVAHMTKGGYLIYDTQSIDDNHFAVRRCLSNYLYIHSCIKWIPFICVLRVREMLYMGGADGVTNTVQTDLEDDLRFVIVPKYIWKRYDRYCYSVFTDDCPVVSAEQKPTSLKANKIISFKEYKTIDKFCEKDD